jgi:CheY-like chemotaxis protein
MLKALLIDPSRFQRSVIASVFVRRNVEVDTAENAAAGLKALAEGRYDILCFSLELGDMRGPEFYREAVRQKLAGNIPALMLAGMPDKAVFDDAIAAGVTDCFRKADLDDLERHVEQWEKRATRRMSGRVLLVEDSDVAANFCTEVMVGLGLSVTRFCTAEEAIPSLEREDYKIIVTDFVLEGLQTGLSVIRAARSQPGRKGELPILALSSIDSVARRVDILRAGANDFVTKPVQTPRRHQGRRARHPHRRPLRRAHPRRVRRRGDQDRIPDGGDPLRKWRKLYEGTSLWWYLQARNKKSVTVNLKHPDGVEVVRRLVAEADIVVENFRPGVLDKLGLGWEALSKINPGLVMVRLSGFGQSGPMAQQPGFGAIGESMGGLRYVTGFPDRPPVKTGISIGDSIAALWGALGALMALRHKEVNGGAGQVVDVALYEAVFAMMESLVPEFDVFGFVRERTGNIMPGITPSNTHTTKDGRHITIGANGDAIFRG